MVRRLAGTLAVAGGCAWLAKVALIWANGGTETTGGVIGFLLLAGFALLGLAAGLRAWYLPASEKRWRRLLASLAAVVAVAAMVDVPILLGWLIFGHGWQAEETGVVLTALLALGIGAHWLRARAGWDSRTPVPDIR